MRTAPFEITRNKKLAEYRDHPVLHEDVNFDKWKQLSRDRAVPIGSVWVAALGKVFGPKTRQSQEA